MKIYLACEKHSGELKEPPQFVLSKIKTSTCSRTVHKGKLHWQSNILGNTTVVLGRQKKSKEIPYSLYPESYR